jgi:hypothetical protein
MYIEFSLPTEPSATALANSIIIQYLHEWSDQYNIPYNTKLIKYTRRITFDDDAHYAFFAMTWNPERRYYALGRWRIVSDLNNKTEFDSRV